MKVARRLGCGTRHHENRSNVGWTVVSILRSGRAGATALIAGSSLVLAPAMAAHANGSAETSNPSTPIAVGEAGTEDNLEEIIVTARRRSEVLEDVPQTINAVTAGELQKLNLQNLTDLSGFVPGLQIVSTSTGFNDNNTLRGVTFNPTAGTQNTVAFYLNDEWVTTNFVNTSNFDVGQIEVLRGPQGTLRGEPAPSGSLTITTRKPDLEQFGGYVTLTGTAFDNANENGAVNLPIIQDKLAVRLAGIADDNDYNGVKSVFNSAAPYSHTYGGRASVRFEPIDSVEANVMYQHIFNHLQSYTQVEGPGASGGTFTAPATAGYPIPAVTAPGYNGPAITPFQLLGVQSYPNENYTTTDIVTGQLDWHIAGQVVSYDGSYWKYQLTSGSTTDAAHQAPGIDAANQIPRPSLSTPTPFFTNEQTQSDEVRIASETPIFGFLDYTAGFFYRNTRDAVDVVQLASFNAGSFGSPLAAANPFIYNPNYTLNLLIQSPTDEKEHSEFLNLTFHLPHDTELAVGGRYLSYEKSGFTEGTLLPNGVFSAVGFPCSVIAPILHLSLTSTYPGTCDVPLALVLKSKTALPYTPQNLPVNNWIYNVSLSHKLNQDLLVYVNSGSSWRPPSTAVGIFNAANDPELTSLLHVQPEKSYSFEGGFKWTFLDNRARLNVAYYHQQFDKFIYFGLPSLYLSDNGSGTPNVTPFTFTSNPDAVVNGVDLDSGFQFTRQWNFNLAASYSNGHLTGSSIPCNPPSGNTTTAAFPTGTHIFLCPSHASTSTGPNFTTTGTTEYDMPVPNTEINAFIRGLYTFYGRNPHASQFYVTPSYGLLNLYMGLRSPAGAWEGSLFVKNALDTQRLLSTSLGNPAITSMGLNSLFGSSGYFTSASGAMVTPRREAGLTFSYSFGSR
jgi:iron complex outermembrane receptor protein